MSERIKSALICQAGACNPRPIAKALLDAIDECRAEGVEEANDPAVFLILHQLVWVLAGNDFACASEVQQARYDRSMEGIKP